MTAAITELNARLDVGGFGSYPVKMTEKREKDREVSERDHVNDRNTERGKKNNEGKGDQYEQE